MPPDIRVMNSLWHHASMRIALPLAIVGIATAAQLACAQPTRFHSVSLEVSQAPLENGQFEYQLTLFQTGFVAGGPTLESGKLIAPDGSEYVANFNEVTRNSFAAIASLAIGDWTAVEQLNGQEDSYQFRVQPFTLDDVFAETPIITSPAPGSAVPTNFVVKWEFDGGGMPSSRGYHLELGPNLHIIDRQLGVNGFYSLGFRTQLPEPGPGQLMVRIDAQSSLPNPTLLSRSPALAGDSFLLTATFETRSATALYRVVPEPGLLAPSLVPVVVLAAIRKRRRV
jgi:hypothetical protein